ncbi:MAG: hypothetical protein RI932_749, partial [Pseudomonadota bacterium]
MGETQLRGALVHPAGKTRLTEAERAERLTHLTQLGFHLTELAPEVAEVHELTAGKPLERAVLLSQALTQRKFEYVWASRGGFGTTELVRFLENLLPPVLPPKLFIGFSDNSFLGNYLAARHPNLTYVHANHAFDSTLLGAGNADTEILFKLMRGEVPESITVQASWCSSPSGSSFAIKGQCIPFNLSLAESFAVLRHAEIPEGCILFLEDINEELFRVVRKFDSLVNAGMIARCSAIVLGNFTSCPKTDGTAATETEIAEIFARKTNIPVAVAPIFGHAEKRMPLVAHAECKLEQIDNETKLTISFRKYDRPGLATRFPADLYPVSSAQNPDRQPKLHFTGVGGTGMAAVAGLFKSAHFEISGSDNPIYPPMDEVIRHIGLNQTIGYHAETLGQTQPDAVILANVITRRNAELKPNLEMESLLRSDIPTFSFPSALRKFFLHRATNIVVSGTHGKTSTTSLITQMLSHLGKDPSLFVGGAPANFQHGYRLGQKQIFVLEGDEYDSALFDKGPKFLHYEPSIALINNIEFDHADIYANIEAIEEEFYRLACLTRDRKGIVVANADDPRVVRVVQRSKAEVIWFGQSSGTLPGHHWKLESFQTQVDGTAIRCGSPTNQSHTFKTRLFGAHNAMNATASFAVMHALKALEERAINKREDCPVSVPTQKELLAWGEAAASFLGVKRRFELIGQSKNIAVFDDFAHHPTAIATTLEAFRAYVTSAQRPGRLIACFDPRNATMRRSVLQEQLAGSFSSADVVFLGKVPVDLRLKEDEALNGAKVAALIGQKATYFPDNDLLLETLLESVRPGD